MLLEELSYYQCSQTTVAARVGLGLGSDTASATSTAFSNLHIWAPHEPSNHAESVQLDGDRRWQRRLPDSKWLWLMAVWEFSETGKLELWTGSLPPRNDAWKDPLSGAACLFQIFVACNLRVSEYPFPQKLVLSGFGYMHWNFKTCWASSS